MLLKKSSCVLYSCVCYHCVGMYSVYICIFLHESEDDYITRITKTKKTKIEKIVKNSTPFPPKWLKANNYIYIYIYVCVFGHVCVCVRVCESFERDREKEGEIYIYIRGEFNKFPDIFLVQAFKIVGESWKFTMLLIYILWDDWSPFMISVSNQQLQQQLEYTLQKPDCNRRWISMMITMIYVVHSISFQTFLYMHLKLS